MKYQLTLYVEKDPVPFVVEIMHGIVFTGNATIYQVQDNSDRNKGIQIYAGNKQITVYGLNYKSAPLLYFWFHTDIGY